jgi:hypothetical protein
MLKKQFFLTAGLPKEKRREDYRIPSFDKCRSSGYYWKMDAHSHHTNSRDNRMDDQLNVRLLIIDV